LVADTPDSRVDVYEFVLENFDSVPQMEALILLWNSRPVSRTREELASRLYVPLKQVEELLRDLVRTELIEESKARPTKYSYFPKSEEQNEPLHSLDSAYGKTWCESRP
jgi:predicted ArsR family transcriptional regulator